MKRRYRSRGGRRTRRRGGRTAIHYNNPFPLVERVAHRFAWNCQLAITLADQRVAFGPTFCLNDPSDPMYDSTEGSNVQPIGFDRYAGIYGTYLCPNTMAKFQFRRTMDENNDNFVGYIGYLYTDTIDDKTELQTIFNSMGSADDLSAGQAFQLFKSFPGIVYRRWGIVDAEKGCGLQFTYNRSSFFDRRQKKSGAGGGTTHAQADMYGQVVGTSITSPTEKAYIIPFMCAFTPSIGSGATTWSGMSTETAKKLSLEVSIMYHTIWQDLQSYSEGAYSTMGPMRDTAAYNTAKTSA